MTSAKDLGKDFFVPDELTGDAKRAAYTAGGLCTIHALALRMKMLYEDGLWDKETDNEIRTQFQTVLEQIKGHLPKEIHD